MKITDYGYYTIHCTHTTGYVHVPSARRVPSEISQWAWDTPFESHHFHWMFVKAGDSDHFYIVNRHSGLCLMLPNDADGTQLRQADYSPSDDLRFRFLLEPADAESSFRIVSYASGNMLVVKDALAKNGQPIVAVPEDTANVGLPNGRFELASVGTATRDVGAPAAAGALQVPVHNLPHLTALEQDLPLSFPDRRAVPVMDEQALPCFVVDDPALTSWRQIEVSPTYTIRHWVRWDKARDREFDGLAERTTTETTEVGMTQLDASSFRSTFKWSLEATQEVGLQIKFLSASAKLTTRLESEVERTRQQSAEHRENRTHAEEVTYPALGSPYRVVTWVPSDVYELCRTNDTHPIRTWVVTREGEDATNCFVEKAPIAPPKKKGNGARQRAADRVALAR